MLCAWILSLLTVLANSFIPEIKSLDKTVNFQVLVWLG